MFAYKRIVLFCLLIIFGFYGHFVFAEEGQPPAVYDPNYWIKPRVSSSDGIIVVRGMTQTIIPEHRTHNPCATIIKFNNGDLQVVDRRSSDLGKSWHKVDSKIGKLPSRSAYQYPEPDGEVLMFNSGLKKTEQKGVFETKFLRSKDNGLTLIKDTAIVRIPQEYERWAGGPCRTIVRAPDGSLLMSMYYYEILDDGKGGKLERKSHSFVIRSLDRGKSWDYFSMIAFDGSTEPIDYYVKERAGLPEMRICGFEEPCLLSHPNGKIFCFMRTGTGYSRSLSNFLLKQSGVYITISDDCGKSWSNADAVTPFGVLPEALVLKSGIMVVGYGRPGNWMMFSKNEGKTWGPIFQFYNDLYPPDGGNYFSIVEVTEGTLLVVYARTNPNDNQLSTIVGTYFFVNPQRN